MKLRIILSAFLLLILVGCKPGVYYPFGCIPKATSQQKA